MKFPYLFGISAFFAVSAIPGVDFALAQTAAPAAVPAQDQKPLTTAPFQLQVPASDPQPMPSSGGADSPGAYFGDQSGSDEDRAAQVHGSFTSGIGYSKGYGTSTMNAAELHISKEGGNGRTFDVQINVQQTKGPGFYPRRAYYAPGYPGY